MQTQTDILQRAAVMQALTDKIEETMLYLYSRWQDESEYENIQDYLLPIKDAIAESGLTNPKMTKRPFGFTATLGVAIVHVTMNSRSFGWKRIK